MKEFTPERKKEILDDMWDFNEGYITALSNVLEMPDIDRDIIKLVLDDLKTTQNTYKKWADELHYFDGPY